MTFEKAKQYKPAIIFPDDNNRLTALKEPDRYVNSGITQMISMGVKGKFDNQKGIILYIDLTTI